MKNTTRSPKKSNKTQNSKVFRPLVASSLALALGVSVVCGVDYHGSSGKVFDLYQPTDPYGTDQIYLDTNSSGDYTVNVGNPQYGIGIKGQIGGAGTHGSTSTGDLIVNFKIGSSLIGNIQTGVASDGNDFSSNQVTFSGGSSWETVLTGDIISYGTGSGGRFDPNNGNHVVFEAGSMAGNIQALSTRPTGKDYNTYGYNTVTFSGNMEQKIDGSITASGGENNIVFSGTGTKTITGSISTQTGNSRAGANTITSTANQLVLGSGGNSNITANNGSNQITATNLILNIGTMSSTGTYNKIDASSSLEIQSGTITAANLGSNYITAGSLILNNMTFNSGTSGNTAKNLLEAGNTAINGNVIIKANNIQNSNSVKLNALKFTGSVTRGNNGKISEITAIANTNEGTRANARNVLSFEGGQSSLVIENINNRTSLGDLASGNNYIGKALTSGSVANQDLDLVGGFDSGNWSDATYQATDLSLTITGDIYAKKGVNFISVGDLEVNTLNVELGGVNNIKANNIVINGSIAGDSTEADSNANNIVANTLTFSSNVAEIKAGTNADGWSVKNRFDISGAATFNNTSSLVIKADSTANAGGEKYNIFRFGGSVGNGTSNTIAIGQILATSVHADLDRTANILSFDGLSTETTLNVGSINDSSTSDPATGTNYIGKNLTSGSGSSLGRNSNFTDGSWSDSAYQANNLVLNVTGDVYAKFGKNYINVKSVSINGTIDGNGGFNNIATSQNFSSGAIQARWSGGNNLIIGGNANFNGNISTEGAKGAATQSGQIV